MPVGLTAHREGLQKLEPFSQESASYAINQVQIWQNKFKNSIGRSFIYASDEFYVLANKNFPAYDSYEGFPQLENGVGLVAKFRHEFYQYLKTISITFKTRKHIMVITGVAAYKLIKKMCDDLVKKVGNLKIEVVCIENKFWWAYSQ